MERCGIMKQINNENKIKFETWGLEWLNTYKKGFVKDNSYLGTYYTPIHNHLIPFFGDMFLVDIKPSHIKMYFADKRSVYAYSTLEKDRLCLSQLFEAAKENGLIKINPVTKNIKIVSDIPAKTKKAYTQEQYNKVEKFAYTHPFGLDILVLMETAISRSELLGLTWPDHDYKNHVIYINNGAVKVKNSNTGKWEMMVDGLKTVYRKRGVPISVKLSQYLYIKPKKIYYRKQAIYPKHIFHSPAGQVYMPENWYRRRYNVFMDELIKFHPDIPRLTPHELRHTRASLWWEDDVDLMSLALLGGWGDLEMLRERYIHPNMEVLREKMNIRQ